MQLQPSDLISGSFREDCERADPVNCTLASRVHQKRSIGVETANAEGSDSSWPQQPRSFLQDSGTADERGCRVSS